MPYETAQEFLAILCKSLKIVTVLKCMAEPKRPVTKTNRTTTGLITFLLLTSCGSQPQVERIELGGLDSSAVITITPSPDVTDAGWKVSDNGKSLLFGKPSGAPYLTLACDLSSKAEPRIDVIRHAQSEPGAKALFAVMGNGVTSRLYLDAKLLPQGWNWQGSYPAGSTEFEVFNGPRDIEATLPGAGTMKLPASPLPHEFIQWCRRSGDPLPKPSIDLVEPAEVIPPPPA